MEWHKKHDIPDNVHTTLRRAHDGELEKHDWKFRSTVAAIKILQTRNTAASLPDHCRVYSEAFLGFRADKRGHPNATVFTRRANSLQSE